MKEHTSYFAASWVWRMRKRQGFTQTGKRTDCEAWAIEESNKENSKALVDTINELSANSRELSKGNGVFMEKAEAKRRGEHDACK